MLINVTEEHIKNGRRADRCSCPIALAIYNNTRYKCDVLSKTVLIFNKGFFYLSDAAVDFIFKFDNNLKVEPFNFELDI